MGCGASSTSQDDATPQDSRVTSSWNSQSLAAMKVSSCVPNESELERVTSLMVSRAEAIKMFRIMDTDNSGMLSPHELVAAFKELDLYRSDEQMAKLIEECDKGCDGLIDQDEFLSASQSVRGFAEMLSDAGALRRMALFQKHEGPLLPDRVLVNMLKAGGSVIMLRDNEGNVYKEMNSKAELQYYTDVMQSRKYFLQYLVRERLIPGCKLGGHVRRMGEGEIAHLPSNEDGYYTQVLEACEGSKEVIIMENLVQGMSNPAMCDFKIGMDWCGSYEGEPGHPERQKLLSAGEHVDMIQKSKMFSIYKKYKDGKNTDGIKFADMTNEHLGLKTKLKIKEIKGLMKSWKHELRAQDSPVKELKFRCCGMKVVPDEGKSATFDFEPQKSLGKIKLTKPTQNTPQEVTELLQDFCQHDLELASWFIQKLQKLALWLAYNTEYRYYASSICFFYDMNDHTKRDVRWLDFAHAHKILHNDGSSGQFVTKFEDPGKATNEAALLAVNNLIECLAPVVWKHANQSPCAPEVLPPVSMRVGRAMSV